MTDVAKRFDGMESAIRYAEELDPPRIGSENHQVAQAGLDLIDQVVAEADSQIADADRQRP